MDHTNRNDDGHQEHRNGTYEQMVHRREDEAGVPDFQEPNERGDAQPTQVEALTPGPFPYEEDDRRRDQDHPRDGAGSRDAQDRSGQS